jgi:threonine/homoserine/homoserine lactone efflux protein
LGFLIHFAWGWLCGFLGTLPFGTINVSIAEMAIQRGTRVAVSMAIGAAFIEFFQSYIALSFYHILTHNEEIERSIIIVCIPIFLVVGIYYIFKENHAVPHPTTKAANAIGAAKGIALSSINLMAIPYFVFIGGYLASANYISLKAEFIASFSAGVVLGSFMTFFIYAKLGIVIKRKSEKMGRYASKIVGIIFIVIAISQAVRYYW